MPDRIYLDYAAAVPLLPEVKKIMDEVEEKAWANASSLHQEGREARGVIDDARKSIADHVGADTEEIIFTSGATESNVLALQGVLEAKRLAGEKPHLVVSKVEHSSIIEWARKLEKMGLDITWLSVDKSGRVDEQELVKSIKENTALVSIIYVNNEVGVVNEIKKLAEVIKSENPNTLFHTDAAQALGWIDFNINGLGVDLLSASSYKLGGPKGVGLLYIKKGIKFNPIFPGTQEWEKRGGTEATSLIAGFAKAVELSKTWPKEQVSDLGDFLISEITINIPDSVCNTPKEGNINHIAHFSFSGVESDVLTLALDREGIAVSPGSACSSGAVTVSHVIEALGIDTQKYPGQLRLSLGINTTRQEIETAVKIIEKVVSELRQKS